MNSPRVTVQSRINPALLRGGDDVGDPVLLAAQTNIRPLAHDLRHEIVRPRGADHPLVIVDYQTRQPLIPRDPLNSPLPPGRHGSVGRERLGHQDDTELCRAPVDQHTAGIGPVPVIHRRAHAA